MRVFSTFTGIGGFEIGIENASVGKFAVDLVGYSEIDKYAIKVFEHHYKGVKNYGDITKIYAEALPDFDCLVGGFPCQAFSIAGRRAGFSDTRGTLFFDLARILQAKQPRLFVFENVKGLLSHDGGRTFRTIIKTIDELGYDCQWQVLNSKDFGVPQNRERVIIIGHLRGTPRPQVLPFFGANSKDIKTLNNARHDYDRVYDKEGIAPALNTGQRGNAQPKIITSSPVYVDGKRTVRHKLSDEAPTIRATQYKSGDNQPKVVSFNRKEGVGKELEVTRALQAGDYRGLNRNQTQSAVLEGGSVRRLTPLECERLQGFPDNWTAVEGMSDTQRYKMCGNAVTTNVIQAVFERILA